MTKIHASCYASFHPTLGACRVLWVDSQNAVCMIHNPACRWATPFGNYCEHPLKQKLLQYDRGERESAPGEAPH